MATSGYAVPTREEALQREEWLDRRGDLSPGSVASAMTSASLNSVWSLFREQSPEEQALARLERQRIEIITNEEITEGEAEWLIDRLGRDGRITVNEQALITFLNKESPKIHPKLQEFVAKNAQAA